MMHKGSLGLLDDPLAFFYIYIKIKGLALFVYQKHRLIFLESCSGLSFINAGNTAFNVKNGNIPFARPKMSIHDQLRYKFVISLFST